MPMALVQVLQHARAAKGVTLRLPRRLQWQGYQDSDWCGTPSWVPCRRVVCTLLLRLLQWR